MDLYIISNKQKNGPTTAYFCEIYGHLLIIPYYFYTNFIFRGLYLT